MRVIWYSKHVVLFAMSKPFTSIVSVALLMLTSCDSCVNEIQEEVVSPDGKMKAVVYIKVCKECGANEPSLPAHVSIVSINDKTSALSTNTIAVSKLAPWIVTWEDNKHLRLVYDVDAKVTYLKTEISNIKINFKVVHRSLQ